MKIISRSCTTYSVFINIKHFIFLPYKIQVYNFIHKTFMVHKHIRIHIKVWLHVQHFYSNIKIELFDAWFLWQQGLFIDSPGLFHLLFAVSIKFYNRNSYISSSWLAFITFFSKTVSFNKSRVVNRSKGFTDTYQTVRIRCICYLFILVFNMRPGETIVCHNLLNLVLYQQILLFLI